MTPEKKIAVRIHELCRQHQLSIPMLAKRSCMSPATIYRILRADGSSETRLESIFKICRGFNITMREFFSADIFHQP